MYRKPELLAPVGDFEKLQMAVAYGADAVYVGGKQFGLRANAKNFDDAELEKAIEYAHAHNVKVYVAVNIFARNKDLEHMEKYLHTLKKINADGVLVADLGAFDIARKIDGLEVHISTQANVTNYHSVEFYKNLSAQRVVLARELSLDEISEINKKVAPFETEVFVHGAMCVAYSGRCLLSNYMIGRDANRGDCSQSCRWKYHLTDAAAECSVASPCGTKGAWGRIPHLNEAERQGEFLPVYEDERGTYIMNSKDLCMIQHIPELVASGVSSFKIEGRMKSAYYVAVVTRAYRQAIDDFFADAQLYESRKDYYMEELKKSSHRDFYTGFYFGQPLTVDGQTRSHAVYTSTHDFVGVVMDYDAENQTAIVQQRNKFSVGDEIEFMKGEFSQVITAMYDADGAEITSAPHPQQIIRVKTVKAVGKFEILRKKCD